MSFVLTFVGGVAVGVVYEKSIRAWKNKLQRAARAAQGALQD